MSRKSFSVYCTNWKNIQHIQNGLKRHISTSVLSPDHVLSVDNRKNCLALLNSKGRNDGSETKNVKKAAVLVPLCKINEKVALLFTVRALHLKVNAGEVAFPGGMSDQSDGNLEATALREAQEEIGIPSNDVEIWGKGPPYFFKTIQAITHEIRTEGVTVTPVLGYIENLQLEKLNINTSEVSQVFAITLEHLSSAENFKTTRFRSGKSSYYTAPVYINHHKRIWGFTAYLTHLILSSLIPDVYNKNIKFRPDYQKVLKARTKSS